MYPDVGACLKCFLDEIADVEALLCHCTNCVLLVFCCRSVLLLQRSQKGGDGHLTTVNRATALTVPVGRIPVDRAVGWVTRPGYG